VIDEELQLTSLRHGSVRRERTGQWYCLLSNLNKGLRP